MRSITKRRAAVKATASKRLIPFADDVVLHKVACQCKQATWLVGVSESGRIGLRCQSCGFVGEIVAEGLTTVKKVA